MQSYINVPVSPIQCKNINSQVSHRSDSKIPHTLPFTKTDNVFHYSNRRKRGSADTNFDSFTSANFLLMEERLEANNPTGHVNTEFTDMAFVGALNLKRKQQKSPAMRE